MCRATKDKASDREAPATKPATAVIQVGGSIHLGQAAELSAGSIPPLLHLVSLLYHHPLHQYSSHSLATAGRGRQMVCCNGGSEELAGRLKRPGEIPVSVQAKNLCAKVT